MSTRKTRLFHTLVVVGAAITGGGLGTVAVVSVTAIPGCGAPNVGYPDIGVPPMDMTIPQSYPDIGVPWDY